MIHTDTRPTGTSARQRRLGQAPLALGILALACVLTINATAAPTPVCKQGQSSGPSKPCTTASAASRPRASVSGGTAVRHRDGDAVTVVRFVDPAAGGYQLEVENTSGIGYINNIDVAPTVANLLDLPMKTADGRVLHEILEAKPPLTTTPP